jgi:hypothetical protein
MSPLYDVRETRDPVAEAGGDAVRVRNFDCATFPHASKHRTAADDSNPASAWFGRRVAYCDHVARNCRRDVIPSFRYTLRR